MQPPMVAGRAASLFWLRSRCASLAQAEIAAAGMWRNTGVLPKTCHWQGMHA